MSTANKTKIYSTDTGGVLIILQYLEGVGWHTTHGGEFYVFEHDQWIPYDHIGYARYLEREGLGKFTIGDKHKILLNSRWKTIDRYGLYKYADEQENTLIGEMVLDPEWDEVLTQVLRDKLYAQEHGQLP